MGAASCIFVFSFFHNWYKCFVFVRLTFFVFSLMCRIKKVPFLNPYTNVYELISFHFRAINMICAPCKRVTGKKMINGFMPLKNCYKSNNVFSWNASVKLQLQRVHVSVCVWNACEMTAYTLCSTWILFYLRFFSHHSNTHKKSKHTVAWKAIFSRFFSHNLHTICLTWRKICPFVCAALVFYGLRQFSMPLNCFICNLF